MNKKQREEQLKFFSQAFHEVVVPLLEDMATKGNIEEIKEAMATKEDIDRIERKLVKIDDRLDRYGGRLDSHGKRISRLETRTGAAA